MSDPKPVKVTKTDDGFMFENDTQRVTVETGEVYLAIDTYESREFTSKKTGKPYKRWHCLHHVTLDKDIANELLARAGDLLK